MKFIISFLIFLLALFLFLVISYYMEPSTQYISQPLTTAIPNQEFSPRQTPTPTSKPMAIKDVIGTQAGDRQPSTNYINEKGERVTRKYSFYPGGNKYWQKDYTDGRINGEVIYWYRNGQMMDRYSYSFGLPVGMVETWHNNGKKKSSSVYVNGKLNGNLFRWNKRGSEVYSAIYVDGNPTKRHGLAPVYNSAGRISSYNRYISGQLIETNINLK